MRRAASSPSGRHRASASPKACQKTRSGRELHARSRADETDVLHPAAQLIEDRTRTRDIGRVAAEKSEQLPFLGRADRSSDRAFDEGRAFFPHFGGKRFFGFRPDGAHLDDEFSGDVARE
jgi:hypothetical protein